MKRLVCMMLAALLLFGCGAAADNWQDQYDLGMRYLNEANYEEAIAAFTEAIRIDPNRAELYVGRAQAYMASGETAENLAAALADYGKAQELGYTDADLWLGLADIYIRQEDYETAWKILEEGLETTGGDSEIQAKLGEMVTDPEGRIRRRSGFDGEGNLVWYHIISYDIEGQEIRVVHYDADGNMIQELNLEQDPKGQSKQLCSYTLDDGELSLSIENYDEAGKMVRWENDSPNNSGIQTFVYDDENRLIRRNFFNSDGDSTGYTLYTYDPVEEYCLTETWYDRNDQLSFQINHFYDEDGKEIRSEETYQGLNLSTSTYEYDELDRQVRYSIYENGILTLTRVYNYFGDSDEVMSQYTYDGEDNLMYSIEY